MRIVTANVNGIRAATRRGGLPWMAQVEADVIALQEVRATTEQLVAELATGLTGWHIAHTEAEAKGRSGVAVLTRVEPLAVRVEVLTPEFATSGRWLEVDLATESGTVTIASVYVPSGEADTPKQLEKYRFLDAMGERLQQLAQGGGHALIVGDLNVAHREIDLKNWKGNLKKAGFLPQERAYFDRWLDADHPAGGWVDVQRRLVGQIPGPHTWWSWRGQAFVNDAGWRIDYHLATAGLAERAHSAQVGRADSYDARWSDHAPVVVDYHL